MQLKVVEYQGHYMLYKHRILPVYKKYYSGDTAHFIGGKDEEMWGCYVLKNGKRKIVAIAENEQKAVEKAQLIAERLNEGTAEKL